MGADRGAFIDQSQSLNIYMSNPNFGKLTSLHFHAWKKGLKTGMYYLRTRAAAAAIKFTVEQNLAQKQKHCNPIKKNPSNLNRLDKEKLSRSEKEKSCSMCSG